jgi:hypothetical protein
MAVTELGKPFDGVIYYWLENTYGVVTEISLNSLPISCKVQDVRIDSGDRHKSLRDIGSPLVCNFLCQTYEPKLHIEYIPQVDDTMIDDVIDRVGSCCSLQSLSFAIGFNKCKTGINESWFRVKGAKPQTVRITGSKNTEYLVTVDYETQSIVSTTSALVGTEPAVLTGAYLQFNVAGEIRKTGGHVVNTDHIAFICNSIDITVNHNLNGYTDHDSSTKAYLVEGAMDIEGSVDITLDGGGALHWGEVLANTAFEIEVDMGNAVGSPRITLPACQWKNTSVDKNISSEAMMSSVPFECKPTSCSTIVGVIPPV